MSDILSLDPNHKVRILKSIDNPDKATHLIFRLLGPNFQKRFQHLVQLEKTPQVFIHGNPHIDNYARTLNGAGMIDFDRSRVGPYCWDIIRFLSSLALRSEKQERNQFLPKETLQLFLDGYMSSYQSPDIYYTMPLFLKMMTPSAEELTTRAYLEANIKWAKKMRKNPLDKSSDFIKEVIKLYLESRNGSRLLKYYKISEAGCSEGSLGKMHYLIALAPIKEDQSKDHILIDIKETYTEADDEWFHNPAEHHGERMVKASNLYAPGVEQRLGFFTKDNIQFWGREIPSFSTKVKKLLSSSEQEELAYCVGVQLGRGHRRSNRDEDTTLLEKDLKKHYELYQKISAYLNEEVKLGLDYLVQSQKLKENFGG